MLDAWFLDCFPLGFCSFLVFWPKFPVILVTSKASYLPVCLCCDLGGFCDFRDFGVLGTDVIFGFLDTGVAFGVPGTMWPLISGFRLSLWIPDTSLSSSRGRVFYQSYWLEYGAQGRGVVGYYVMGFKES